MLTAKAAAGLSSAAAAAVKPLCQSWRSGSGPC
jgi:hypothetical protein